MESMSLSIRVRSVEFQMSEFLSTKTSYPDQPYLRLTEFQFESYE